MAVRTDSSVILFDSGNFLRIGIRHRESQTLFLSDLFDVHNSSEPSYGKLMVGMHIAIAQDAFERLERVSHSNRDAKRKEADSEVEEGSAPVVNPAVARESNKLVTAVRQRQTEAERRRKALKVCFIYLLACAAGQFIHSIQKIICEYAESLQSGSKLVNTAPPIPLLSLRPALSRSQAIWLGNTPFSCSRNV